MSRIGGATAPVKCEESRRTPVEIKQEPSSYDGSYDETHAKHRADFSADNPSSSSLLTAETDYSYEFLGNMKYEADESTNLTATGHLASKKLLGLLAKIKVSVLISKKRDVCPLCQQVYNTKPGTYYGDHRKREFIAHLAKAHDYSHLQGYCRKMQCKRCKAKRERWTFVVEDGINYKFSDVCSRCQECTCQRITDDSGGPPCPKSHCRGSITSLWKNFMAHRETNAELQERPEATADARTATKETSAPAEDSTKLTTTELLSSKKPAGIVCHLCQKDYCKKTHKGSRKQYFVAHLVKSHHYRHLRGHSVLTRCRSCKIEKRRWTFVVGEGGSYKFSDECTTCRRGRPSMASQWKNFMARQELNAEVRESPQEAAEAPSTSAEPSKSEAPLQSQQ